MSVKPKLESLLDEATWTKYPRYLPGIIGIHESIFLMTIYRWWDWDRRENKTGWAYRTADELRDETGLSEKQQRIARENLRTRGLLREFHHRQIHKLYFRINEAPFEEVLRQAIEKKNRSETKLPILPPATTEDRLETSAPRPEAPAPAPVVAAPVPFDIEESTEENSEENSSPKPSSGGRGLSSYPLLSSNEPGALPSSDDKCFPKNMQGKPDWLVAIQKFDARSFTHLSTLFPNTTFPANDPALARKYWKARQGVLTDGNLEMFVRYYRETRHDDPQPSTWKVMDYYSFLTPRHLQRAVPLVQSYLQEKIAANRYQIELTGLLEVATNEVALMHDRVQKGGPSALKDFLATNNEGVAAVLAYIRLMPVLSNTVKLEQIDGGALRWDLGHNLAWVTWCRNHKLSTTNVFGFSEQEIMELHKEVTEGWENENLIMSQMIGRPYKPINLLGDEGAALLSDVT